MDVCRDEEGRLKRAMRQSQRPQRGVGSGSGNARLGASSCAVHDGRRRGVSSESARSRGQLCSVESREEGDVARAAPHLLMQRVKPETSRVCRGLAQTTATGSQFLCAKPTPEWESSELDDGRALHKHHTTSIGGKEGKGLLRGSMRISRGGDRRKKETSQRISEIGSLEWEKLRTDGAQIARQVAAAGSAGGGRSGACSSAVGSGHSSA